MGENKTEESAFQSARVEILWKPFPVPLPFALAAQESQQVSAAIPPDPIRHQHLYPLASRRPPHPQAHPVQKSIDIAVAHPGLMKLPHRLVQTPRKLGHGLRTYRLARDGGPHPPYLPGADPAQNL